jgi:hypothetical protein
MTTAAALVYLAVSAENALFQGVALWYAHRYNRRRRGTVRTIASRVLIALVYVGLSVITLLAQQALSFAVALIVFSGIQVVWQVNTIIDLLQRPATQPSAN